MARRLSMALAVLLLLGCKSPQSLSPAPDRSAPVANVRQLRADLPNRSMPQVVSRLGKPGYVTTLSDREIWEYRDRAVDPVTGKKVALLEIHFVNRRVERVEFFYGD